MKIGIIGTGRIGTALGALFSRAGHDVTFGSARARPEAAGDDRIVGIDEATRGAHIVVVAIPFGAWPAFARDHGAALAGKTVIDTSNTNASRDGAIVEEVKREGVGTLAFVARLLPGARLVKAFNTFESDVLVEQAGRQSDRLAHPIAGDDPASVAEVARLVRDVGYDAVVVGDAASARRFDEGTPAWNRPMTSSELMRVLGTA